MLNMTLQQVITISIIVIIIIIITIIYMNGQSYNNFMSGFWKAESEYCEGADIDNMVLYINNNTNSGHLIISKDETIIENSSFDIKKNIIRNIANLIPFNQMMTYNIRFISKSDDFLWKDKEYGLSVSMITGSMILYKDGVLYSKLYKDNDISNKFLDYVQLD